MKKNVLALIILAAVAFYGCTNLDRVNPTDPKSGANYEGMHYMGSIGSFSSVEDIILLNNEIWCVDSGAGRIYKYSTSGDLDFWLNSVSGAIVSPTGICSDGTNFYVADKNAVVKLTKYDPQYVSNTAQPQMTGNSSYNFIKCASSSLYVFAATTTGIYRFNLATYAIDTTITMPVFTSISDLKYNPATDEFIAADSGTNRITIFDHNGAVLRHFDFTFNIIGFAVKGNDLYVPCVFGIRQYAYDTGIMINTFADYGDGAGKITAPGCCMAYDNYVLVGIGNTIKTFGP
jgi:hypothetical protein